MLDTLYDSTYQCKYLEQSTDDSDDDAYRRDLLAVFKLEIFDTQRIDYAISHLVREFRSADWFIQMLKSSPFYNEGDYCASLMGLYNYDQFQSTHETLCSHILSK